MAEGQRFSVSMDDELYTRVVTAAYRADRSMGAQVRFLVREQLLLQAGDHPTLTLAAYSALDAMSEEIWALRRKVDELATPQASGGGSLEEGVIRRVAEVEER